MRSIPPPGGSAVRGNRSLPSWVGSGCSGCCRSCWRRLIADGSAHCVGGELDPVGVAELLEHVLEMGGDGAPRDVQPLGDLAIREPLGHEADHPQFGRGQAVPSEGRAARRAAHRAGYRGCVAPIGLGRRPTRRRAARRRRPPRSTAAPLRLLWRCARGRSPRPHRPRPTGTGGAPHGGRRRLRGGRRDRWRADRGSAGPGPGRWVSGCVERCARVPR